MPNNPPIALGIAVTDATQLLFVNLEETTMNTTELFEQAKQIAATASLLDSTKNEFPDETRDFAAQCVDNLHILAEKLAGNQVGKIYF
jgi:hypothetical protein